MTNETKLKTDVNLNMNINDEPHEIAEKIMEGFLIPVLNRKTQVSGLQGSVQIYIDLSYLMLSERVRMVGREGISEMRDLIDEFEAELNDFDAINQVQPVINAREFMELSTQVS